MQKKWRNAIGPSLFHIMTTSPEPWGIKDNRSVFVYTNRHYKNLINIGSSFNIEGRMDHELPAATAEFAEAFRLHDRKTERLKTTLSSLEVHPFGEEQTLQAYCFEKMPCISPEGMVIGTIFHGFPLSHYYTKLSLQLNTLIRGEKISSASWISGLDDEDNFLSTRQHEIVFLLCVGFTPKEIAERLGKSERTIRNHIERIKHQSGVNNAQQLKEYAWQQGWVNKIPDHLLRNSSILMN